LLQYFPGLKIQWESEEHDPAGLRKQRVSQINPPVMLHHPQLSAISKMMQTQVDPGLPSNGRRKLGKTKTQQRRAARAETHTMLFFEIL
jgi:hypothetical protein